MHLKNISGKSHCFSILNLLSNKQKLDIKAKASANVLSGVNIFKNRRLQLSDNPREINPTQWDCVLYKSIAMKESLRVEKVII
jgi:hypothetical protein